MPGRCAAPPAPAIMTRRPRSCAVLPYCAMSSGVLCAETMRISCATPKRSHISAAPRMVGRSESLPMTMPTSGAMRVSFQPGTTEAGERAACPPCRVRREPAARQGRALGRLILVATRRALPAARRDHGVLAARGDLALVVLRLDRLRVGRIALRLVVALRRHPGDLLVSFIATVCLRSGP